MRITTRAEWGATPWRRTRARVPLSARRYLVVHYHGGPVAQQYGVAVPRTVEAIHLANGWSGTGYNFMVDQNGAIYEGHGWYLQGAHSPPHNRDGIGVYVAVGGNQRPSEAALRSVRWLYDEMSRLTGREPIKWWHGRDFATACPGPHLIEWVKAGMPTTGAPAATVSDFERLLAMYKNKAEFEAAIRDNSEVGANRALWEPPVKGAGNNWGASLKDSIARSAYNTTQLRAEMAGMQKAIEALASAQGADPAVIRDAVRAGVSDALGDLEAEVKLTIDNEKG